MIHSCNGIVKIKNESVITSNEHWSYCQSSITFTCFVDSVAIKIYRPASCVSKKNLVVSFIPMAGMPALLWDVQQSLVYFNFSHGRIFYSFNWENICFRVCDFLTPPWNIHFFVEVIFSYLTTFLSFNYIQLLRNFSFSVRDYAS